VQRLAGALLVEGREDFSKVSWPWRQPRRRVVTRPRRRHHAAPQAMILPDLAHACELAEEVEGVQADQLRQGLWLACGASNGRGLKKGTSAVCRCGSSLKASGGFAAAAGPSARASAQARPGEGISCYPVLGPELRPQVAGQLQADPPAAPRRARPRPDLPQAAPPGVGHGNTAPGGPAGAAGAGRHGWSRSNRRVRIKQRAGNPHLPARCRHVLELLSPGHDT
jgi:hypothetical protein